MTKDEAETLVFQFRSHHRIANVIEINTSSGGKTNFFAVEYHKPKGAIVTFLNPYDAEQELDALSEMDEGAGPY